MYCRATRTSRWDDGKQNIAETNPQFTGSHMTDKTAGTMFYKNTDHPRHNTIQHDTTQLLEFFFSCLSFWKRNVRLTKNDNQCSTIHA